MTTNNIRQLEKAEFDCLDALSKLRAAKAKVLRGSDTLRKAAGSDPAMIDIGGRAYTRLPDGSYREVARDPTERVYISGTGGGRVAQETEERAIAVIKAHRNPGRILPRPIG